MEPDYIIESIKRTARELFRQNGYHKTSVNTLAKKAKIAKASTILRVSRLTYTACNELIGWEFIRESANAQEYLKTLSEDLEFLLLSTFIQNEKINEAISEEKLTFLIKSSKSIVFSFAFTAVSDADVRKNFISFQKEILPYLVQATVQ